MDIELPQNMGCIGTPLHCGIFNMYMEMQGSVQHVPRDHPDGTVCVGSETPPNKIIVLI